MPRGLPNNFTAEEARAHKYKADRATKAKIKAAGTHTCTHKDCLTVAEITGTPFTFASAADLYYHQIVHLSKDDPAAVQLFECTWEACEKTTLAKGDMLKHIRSKSPKYAKAHTNTEAMNPTQAEELVKNATPRQFFPLLQGTKIVIVDGVATTK